MKIWLSALAAVFIVAMYGTALAVPPGMEAQWETPAGKVVFSGQIHADKGKVCDDCHPAPFEQKRNPGQWKMTDMDEGKACGKCHNGEIAFSTADPASCTRCHQM